MGCPFDREFLTALVDNRDEWRGASMCFYHAVGDKPSLLRSYDATSIKSQMYKVDDAFYYPFSVAVVCTSKQDDGSRAQVRSAETMAALPYLLAKERGDDLSKIDTVLIVRKREALPVARWLVDHGAVCLYDDMDAFSSASFKSKDFVAGEIAARENPVERMSELPSIRYVGEIPEKVAKLEANSFISNVVSCAAFYVCGNGSWSVNDMDWYDALTYGRCTMPSWYPRANYVTTGNPLSDFFWALSATSLRKHESYQQVMKQSQMVVSAQVIWKAYLKISGLEDSMKNINPSSPEARRCLEALGDRAGVEAGVQAFFDGVPLEHICGGIPTPFENALSNVHFSGLG